MNANRWSATLRSWDRAELLRTYRDTDAWYRDRIGLVERWLIDLPMWIPHRRRIVKALVRHAAKLRREHGGLFATYMREARAIDADLHRMWGEITAREKRVALAGRMKT